MTTMYHEADANPEILEEEEDRDPRLRAPKATPTRSTCTTVANNTRN